MLKVKINNRGRQPLPTYATALSAGMDLRANIEEDITLLPLQRQLVPTGLHIALPEGYVLNTPGTVDADYRGEIMVLLVNFSNEPFTVKDGERIAQMVIAKHEKVDFELVDTLDETERGAGGYGHTGLK